MYVVGKIDPLEPDGGMRFVRFVCFKNRERFGSATVSVLSTKCGAEAKVRQMSLPVNEQDADVCKRKLLERIFEYLVFV